MDADQVPLRRLGVSGLQTWSRRWKGWQTRAILAALLAVAAWLRWVPLVVNRFHEDEALYSTWALRIASGIDPLLLDVLVDKPPFLVYVQAALFRLLGISEVVARMPGLFAGVGTVVCVYGLGSRLYGQRAGVLASAALALSPFHISLSGTAFTDPILLFWIVATLWAIAARRWGVAGVMLGLAASTKQHWLIFVPLVILLAIVQWSAGGKTRRGGRRIWPVLTTAGISGVAVLGARRQVWPDRAALQRGATMLAGVAGPLALTTWWDMQRWATRPSYFDRSISAYGGLQIVGLDELLGRAKAWFQLAGYLGTSATGNILILLSCAVVLIHALRVLRESREPETRSQVWTDLIWLTFGLSYLALHVVVRFQPWDRYLLPLSALASLMVGRAGALVWVAVQARMPRGGFRQILGSLMAVIWMVGLVPAAVLASSSRIPIGTDHGAYDGVATASAWLEENAGISPVFHQHLGWHLGYYLFASPVDHRWYPDAEVLVSDVIRAGGGVLAATGWQDVESERRLLERAGYKLQPAARFWGRVESSAISLHWIVPHPGVAGSDRDEGKQP